MKRILTLSIIGFLITTCSHDKDCCINTDIAISIKYLNKVGENLFDPENGLSESDITVYHRIDGNWMEYFEGNRDYPKGIRTVQREDGIYLVVFPSTELVKNDYSETKIEFPENGSDIIKTEIDKSNSTETVTKVWYNDQLKWEGFQTERIFEIIK